MRDNPETFWAWLAGFVDGDGCIGIYRQESKGVVYQAARLVIAQKDRAVLDHIVAAVGAGSVSKRGTTACSKATFGGTVMFHATFGSRATREVCAKLLPYLVTDKKAKAQMVLDQPGLWKKSES